MHWQNCLKAIGIILLIWIIYTVNWVYAVQAFFELKPVFIVCYIACFIAMNLVRSFRLRFALSRLGHSISFNNCYVATMEPAFFAVVTPGRLGELSRVGYIHGYGVPIQEALSFMIIERFVDIFILLLFGAAGAVYIFMPSSDHLIAFGLPIIGVLLFLFIIRKYDFIFCFVQRHFRWILRWEPSSLSSYRRRLMTSFNTVIKGAGTPMLLLGLVSIILNLVQIFFLAKAFSFDENYLVIVFAYVASAFITMIPISVGGLGTREATYVMIMGRIGILKEQALLFSLIDGVVVGIFVLFLLIFPLSIYRRIKSRSC